MSQIKQQTNKIPASFFKFSDLFTAHYRLITAVLVLLPLLIYWQVYDFAFVWDDKGYRSTTGHLKNPFIVEPSLKNFTQLFSQQFFAMYIPITYFIWGILKFVAELLSLPFNSVLHITNVVVHIVNGLLVFTLVKQFVANKWAVLIGSLFFLLHPVQVEVVAWVSEFRTLLAFFFSLTALYLYLKNQAKPNVWSLLLFTLALLSKPSAVTLVAFVFVINHFHYKFKLSKNIEKTLLFALIALTFVLIAYTIQFEYNTEIFQHSIAIWQRPFAWFDSIVFYLYQLFFPYHLSASYTLSTKFISSQWWFYPLALLPLGLGYLLWLKREKQPLLIFAGILFIAGFFVTSGWINFGFQSYSLVADRYLYFAMIGVALFAATLISKSNKYWQWFIISILLIFSLLSVFRQIPIWQNEFALWSHSVNYEVGPNYAHKNLATYFNNKGAALNKQKKYQSAIEHLDKAIELYQKTKNNSGSATAFANKGRALFLQKKYQPSLQAFNKAIELSPKSDKNRISYILSHKSVSLLWLKKYQQAIKESNKSIQYNVKETLSHNVKIQALTILKQCKQAKTAFKQAQQHKIKLQTEIVNRLKSQCYKQ